MSVLEDADAFPNASLTCLSLMVHFFDGGIQRLCCIECAICIVYAIYCLVDRVVVDGLHNNAIIYAIRYKDFIYT